MALAYPLSFEDFFDKINPFQASFELPPSSMISGTTGAGELVTANVGARLWSGICKLNVLELNDAEEIKAMLADLGSAGKSFFIYPFQKPGPVSDPLGTLISGYAPKMGVITDPSFLVMKSMPLNMKITTGDFVGYQYGADPTRYGVHQVRAGTVTSGAGVATVQLTAPMRPGYAEDISLVWYKPKIKAIVVPDSINTGSAQGNNVSGLTFNWQQTLR